MIPPPSGVGVGRIGKAAFLDRSFHGIQLVEVKASMRTSFLLPEADRVPILGSRRRRIRSHRTSKRRVRANLQVETLESRVVLSGNPIITEFLAVNDRVLYDQDGDDSDWIELHNAGDSNMSLDRWYLTDDAENLRKWRFPDVQLDAGSYLIVFASGKDRNDPANELHTNFRLDAAGEYLAIVEPDGQTIAFDLEPDVPPQVVDVSYGIPTGTEYSTLLSAGALARVMIPTDGSLDPTEPDVVEGTWLDPALQLEDDQWLPGSTGIGYVPLDEPIVIADSVAEFSGVQGQDNWYYGAWTESFDGDGIYTPSDFAPLSPDTSFDAVNNVWYMGAIKSLKISDVGGHPASAAVSLLTTTAVRRWVSETEGELTITGRLSNPDPTGDGVLGRILVNGEEVYRNVVNGGSEEYSVTFDVSVDDQVDFLLSSGDAEDETGDGAEFTAVIQGIPIRVVPIVDLADSNDDWSRDGIQGVNGWHYGYYSQRDDANGSYQPGDFQEFDALSWNRSRWEIPGNVYDTQVQSTSLVPHADDNGVHWPIRRWVSTYAGDVTVQWELSKSTSLTGDGVTGRVFHNGVEVDSAQIAADDRTGVIRTVEVFGVKAGDSIDIALDPTGVDGDPLQPNASGDRSIVKMAISRRAELDPSVQTDIGSEMRGASSSAYIRIPFEVRDLSALDEITLQMRYDDGFVAYVNGIEVASANAPEVPRFDSVALAERPVEEATLYEAFNITSHRDAFMAGENVLQIHALNTSADDEDLLILPQITIGTAVVQNNQFRYFLQPTPGTPNGLGVSQVGPLVVDVQHTPNLPNQAEPIVIAAEVSRTFLNVSSVSLTYRVMFGDEITVAMADDGTGDDAEAGDGIFTATLPAGIAEPGQMVRWYVTARDVEGRTTRFPSFEDPNNTQQYLGTIINDPTLESNLPVFHWFVERTSQAMNAAGAYGALFYNGELYDNVHFSIHGQSSSGFPTQKKSMNVDFPRDHRFQIAEGMKRVDDINLLTNFADKSKLRNTLAYEQRAFAGAGYHLAFPVRVQHNGEFFAVYDFVEDPDEIWLERIDLNPEGSLYKMYNSFESATGEKKTRQEEGFGDLSEFMSGMRTSNTEQRENFLFDNVNLAGMVNYLAAFVLTSNVDCCHKNYYAYRDTGVTDEWHFLIWDVDLTQGRVWGGFGLAYFDDTMYPDRPLFMGGNNQLIQRLYNLPGFREMYLRRVRSLIDGYVKPPGTPREELPLETRVDELYELLKVEADLDNAKNPATWGQTGQQTFEEAVQILLNEYSEPRREWLYYTQTVQDDTGIEVIISGEPGETEARYFVPSDESLGRTWTALDFDDTGWNVGLTGLGFGRDSEDHYYDFIKTDIKDQMTDRTSVYLRVPFEVEDPSQIEDLTLRMKVDDGFVAYLNGVEVARDRLRQDEPTFDSTALSRPDSQAVEYFNVVISKYKHLLQPGTNVLAVQAINQSTTSDDMLVIPSLVEGRITGGGGQIPKAQVGNPKIDFGTIEFNPASGNQNEEYIALVNNQAEAVDISGWRLEGDVEITFQPGTVIPAGWTFYTTPDARAFRARSEGPSGNMSLFVQGNYEGRLSNTGGSVQLIAADGEVVNSATYEGEATNVQKHLRVSELMYHPTEPRAAELAVDNSLVADDFEYVELVNTSETETIDLRGVRFTNGVIFDFTTSAVTELSPGQRVLVVRHPSAFLLRYGEGLSSMIAGSFAAGSALRDSGETLRLEDGSGGTVLEFTYSDQADQGWPWRADGEGSSLQIIDAMGDYNDPTNWRPSTEVNGSPGSSAGAASSGIVINELLSRPSGQPGDQIELYNPTTMPIDLAGYYLSDSASPSEDLLSFALPAVTIPAGGYVVFDEGDFNVGPNAFGLSGTRGEQLFLILAAEGVPTHFVDSVLFGPSALGESFGRFPNGSGSLAPMLESTFAFENSAPRVGPVGITEVNYNPGTPSSAALAIDPELTSDDLEFVEIQNPTSGTIALDEWQLRGGIEYDFAEGTSLESGETVVVISFNPANPDNATRLAAFRAHYGIGEQVQLVGGYDGQLNNQGEAVRLLRPETPLPDDPATIIRLLEDEVFYSNRQPWPDAAAGSGRSLTRQSISDYGNTPDSWSAAVPTPGSVDSIVGDLTGDGTVDVLDIDRLSVAIQQGDAAFDLTGDGTTDLDDVLYLVRDVLGTSIGDVNLDGSFDTSDLVRILQAGEFNDGVVGNSTWADGDWNCDGEFDSGDLLFAFQWGAYEAQSTAPAAVALAAVAAAIDTLDSETAGGDLSADPSRDPLPINARASEDLAISERESLFQDYDPEFLDDRSVEDALDAILGSPNGELL